METPPSPDFCHTDFEGMKQELRLIDWFDCFDQYAGTADVYRKFCMAMYALMAKYVPFKDHSTLFLKYPKHIQSLLQQKDGMCRNSSFRLDNPLYKKVCRDISFHLKKFLSNYERRLALSKNPKKLFLL